MQHFSPRHALLLTLLTVTWGCNWPLLKIGVTGFAPMSFRTLSMWISLPVLVGVLYFARLPWRVPRAHWPALFWLSVTNMLFWHVAAMLSLQSLSSGRAAILGYTMPIFSAVWGLLFYGQRLSWRHAAGILAAVLGVAFLLWHEFGKVSGSPWAALGMLSSAAVWAYGTQQLRHTKIPVSVLAITFWITVITTVVMTGLSALFEREDWARPISGMVWFAILYNALLIFGFAQPVWFFMARTLPPIASTLSVMMIPVLGIFSGAWFLGEVLHWQDWAAMGLMMLAIASVLWPAAATQGVPTPEALPSPDSEQDVARPS